MYRDGFNGSLVLEVDVWSENIADRHSNVHQITTHDVIRRVAEAAAIVRKTN
jgi:hypothetical protein